MTFVTDTTPIVPNLPKETVKKNSHLRGSKPQPLLLIIFESGAILLKGVYHRQRGEKGSTACSPQYFPLLSPFLTTNSWLVRPKHQRESGPMYGGVPCWQGCATRIRGRVRFGSVHGGGEKISRATLALRPGGSRRGAPGRSGG